MPINIGNTLDYAGTGYDESLCKCQLCGSDLAPNDIIIHHHNMTNECPFCEFIVEDGAFINYVED